MKWLVIFLILIIVGAGAFYWLYDGGNSTNNGGATPAENLTSENAELIAFGFVQDFIAVAPPEPDQAAAERIMNVLSESAKTRINRITISSDLARFMGVQDVPDQGVSVEDLQIVSPTESYLVVGLNYSGGRVLRNIHLVAEGGEWRVDKVSIPQT